MKKLFITAGFLLATILANAQPPEPPTGKRWIFNETFSDEFNGTHLDGSKWYDYHPTWKGREPGLFLPSQVKVGGGYMTIRGEKMPRDTVITYWDGTKGTFNIKCGAVVSKSTAASFGYYECRFKAAKTTMSTTFWFSTKSSYPGPEPCQDRYGLEWDVQECIGREGNFSGSGFARGMHSNAHFWYTPCVGEKQDIRATQVEFDSDKLASDTFNVYGGWWKDRSTATYYYNGGEGKSHKFPAAIKDNPFDQTMGMNLVSETYPFPWISLPTDEELADSTKNICYYDWVRAYTLIGVDSVPGQEILVQNPGFESGDFRNWAGWGGNPREVVDNNQHSGNYCVHIKGPGAPEYQVLLKRNTDYILSCYGKVVSGKIFFGIKDNLENRIGGNDFEPTDTVYTKRSFEFNTGTATILKFYFYAQGEGDEGYADDFQLVEKNPGGLEQEETIVFPEGLDFPDQEKVKPARSSLDFLMTYTARADREINLSLFNPSGTLVGEQKHTALAGYGKKHFSILLDSIPAAANGYRLLADIRPSDSSFADTFRTATYIFDLLRPVKVDLTVLDPRDNSPVAGATVTIDDLTGITGADGKTSVEGISPGDIYIEIIKDGFEPFVSGDYYSRNDTSMSISLTPLSYTLTIYITNEHTGEPVSNAGVDIGGVSRQTDYEGKNIRLIYSGTYNAIVSHERYHTLIPELVVKGDSVIRLSIRQALADARFIIQRDSSSLYAATVSINGESANTSPVGLVTFQDLKTDTAYIYSVEYMSETFGTDTVTFLADSTIRLNYLTPAYAAGYRGELLRLFPNPAGEFLRVGGLQQDCEYRIRDVYGRLVQQGTVRKEGTIDLSGHVSGIYILETGRHPVVRFSILH